MQYKAHLAGGLATGVLIAQPVTTLIGSSSPTLAVGAVIAGSLLGSLLPDIDHRGSYIGRRLPILSFLASAVGHRGPTHAPFIVSLLSLLFGWLLLKFAPVAIAGWLLLFLIGSYAGTLSHILLDALTPRGVPAMYPFSKKHVRLASFKTGGWFEHIFSIFLVISSVIYFYRFIW